MYTHTFQLRVRYGDTDQMGYVYYGNYAYYYEQGRAEAIRALGITYKQLEENGIMMPITRMNIKYIKPARYDELLSIVTHIPEWPGRIITFTYDVINEAGECINNAETQLIFVDAHTRKPCSAPQMLLDKLKPHFQK